MTEQQFLRQIKRLLHCKADKKREILRQLESDIASAKEGQFGDLIVTYNVKVPTNLTDRQKELFRELQSMN